ncbi:MAG: hypothetical protein MUC59_03800 [Saprospiraceae bacterium]|nr:hypothetical protein [Saprospiraceae bacterium]
MLGGQGLGIELQDFKATFSTKSLKRQQLVYEFMVFLEGFKNAVTSEFVVWIDGSAVSTKTEPNDIDAVFFIDFKVCERKKSSLDNEWFNGSQKNTKGLDLYYSIVYPPAHSRYYLTHLDRLYWEDLYGHTRIDDSGKQFEKGFLEIKFK